MFLRTAYLMLFLNFFLFRKVINMCQNNLHIYGKNIGKFVDMYNLIITFFGENY